MTARRDSWRDKNVRARPDGCHVSRELDLFNRPTLTVRQVGGLETIEELQHARQALLVIDALDGRLPAWRIGGYVVCRGTEISINLRAMAFPRSVFLAIGLSGLRVLPFNPVLQHPDLLGLELDRVATPQVR
jgi:hypothetical protein